MIPPVGVLAVMRLAANLADTTGDRLATENRPGHCDYISKQGAAANCKLISVEVEEARAAVAELIEAAKRVIASDDAHQHAPDADDFALMIEFADAHDNLCAAIARVGGGK